MKRKIYIPAGLFTAIISFTLSANAQNTVSPYSIYGPGDIDYKMYNRTSGMGGTGLALRSSGYLIDNNPAGIAGLTRSFYVFSVAAAGKTVSFSGTPISSSNSGSNDFWVKGASFAIKINKFWASSFGFSQLSNVNYQFTGTKQIEGSTSLYDVVYEGTGGLNDYYWTNAFSIGKHLSLGVKSSFIAGGIGHTETETDAALAATIQSTQQDYMYHLKFEYGAIYNTALNKKWDFSVGGKFSYKTKLPSDRTLTVIENGATTINNQYVSSNSLFLPTTTGAGISFSHNKKATFAADYIFDNWAPLNQRGIGWQLVNNQRISAGAEFSKQQNFFGQVVEKKFLQVGAYYNTGYLMVGDKQINQFGITAGTGGYLKSLMYNLALDVGQRGTRQNNLIKENYFQITLAISYRDFLASKGRKYD